MPSLLDSGNAAIKADLDAVAKNQLRIDAGSDGVIDGSISTTRKGVTFTAYVKALVSGPQKSVRGGVRIDKQF